MLTVRNRYFGSLLTFLFVATLACTHVAHARTLDNLSEIELNGELKKAQGKLREFVVDFSKLCKQSREYASTAQVIKKYRGLHHNAQLMEKELSVPLSKERLFSIIQRLIDLLSKSNHSPQDAHANIEKLTLLDAHEVLLDVFDEFLLKHHKTLMPQITNVGIVQRTFLKTLSTVFFHVSHAHLDRRFNQILPPDKNTEEEPAVQKEKVTFTQALKKRLPFFLLTSSKIGIDWGINEIRPAAGASTAQRWLELLTSNGLGFLIARAIVGNSQGFKSATMEAVFIDVFNNLTRAKFYLNTKSHLYKPAYIWSYLWTCSVLLGDLRYVPQLLQADYETLTTILSTVGNDVLTSMKDLMGEAIPGLLETGINWPATLYKKPRRRAITYLIAIAISNFMKAAGKAAA